MTNNNWQEEYRKLDSVRRCIFMQKEVEDFIETQIAQAKREGAEEMKEKVLSQLSEPYPHGGDDGEYEFGFEDGKMDESNNIRNFISSL